MRRAILGLLLLIFGGAPAWAEEARLHPPFPLKDADGANVLESGLPVSPTKTCAGCHDTDYIASHSYHAEAVELDRWDPLRYLVASRADTDPAAWLRARGRRYVGGPDSALDMDCFVCHLQPTAPAFWARAEVIASGTPSEAATASLVGSGLVSPGDEDFVWNKAAFTAEGNLDLEQLAARGIRLGRPTAGACGQCHGPTPQGRDPVRWRDLAGGSNLETRGQVFSAQRLRDSALNLAGKGALERPFDVHAERLLSCRDCHYAPNHPAHAVRSDGTRPAHLTFDARRPSLAEFLRKPNHHFARGRDGSMKDCRDCHAAESTHAWLPAVQTHMQAMRCEVCHVPEVHSPARRVTDWTIPSAGGDPRVEYRGVEGPVAEPTSLITGYRPLLLPRADADGRTRLAPYNVIAFWYWVSGEPSKPVPLKTLKAALFVDGDYHPDVFAAFDLGISTTSDPHMSRRSARPQVVLDTPAKVAAVRARLVAVGVDNPSIAAEMRPYGLHHTVATGRFATRECTECHGESSRLAASLAVASFAPGGVLPTWAGDDRVRPTGRLTQDAAGALLYTPRPAEGGLYVIGHDRAGWIDVVGLLAAVLVLLGALTHGALRILAARKRRQA